MQLESTKNLTQKSTNIAVVARTNPAGKKYLKEPPERLLTNKGALVAGRLCHSKVGGEALLLLCCFVFGSFVSPLQLVSSSCESLRWQQIRPRPQSGRSKGSAEEDCQMLFVCHMISMYMEATI